MMTVLFMVAITSVSHFLYSLILSSPNNISKLSLASTGITDQGTTTQEKPDRFADVAQFIADKA